MVDLDYSQFCRFQCKFSLTRDLENIRLSLFAPFFLSILVAVASAGYMKEDASLTSQSFASGAYKGQKNPFIYIDNF